MVTQQCPTQTIQHRMITPRFRRRERATIARAGSTAKLSSSGSNRSKTLLSLPLRVLSLGSLKLQVGGQQRSSGIASVIHDAPKTLISPRSPLLNVHQRRAVADGHLGKVTLRQLSRQPERSQLCPQSAAQLNDRFRFSSHLSAHAP
jgi:hypothetical protein